MRRLLLPALLALSACAVSVDDQGLHVTGAKRSGLTLDQVRQLTAADLAAADAKAKAAGDRPGSWCWEYLMAVPSPVGTAAGVAGAVEDARLIAMAAAGPCSGILSPIVAAFGVL